MEMSGGGGDNRTSSAVMEEACTPGCRGCTSGCGDLHALALAERAVFVGALKDLTGVVETRAPTVPHVKSAPCPRFTYLYMQFYKMDPYLLTPESRAFSPLLDWYLPPTYVLLIIFHNNAVVVHLHSVSRGALNKWAGGRASRADGREGGKEGGARIGGGGAHIVLQGRRRTGRGGRVLPALWRGGGEQGGCKAAGAVEGRRRTDRGEVAAVGNRRKGEAVVRVQRRCQLVLELGTAVGNLGLRSRTRVGTHAARSFCIATKSPSLGRDAAAEERLRHRDATSSTFSSASTGASNLLHRPVSEKLRKSNHTLWKAQVSAVVCGARLQGHLTGAAKKPDAEITATVDGKIVKQPNPVFEDWDARDQQVLSYILSSLTRDVLVQVATCEIAVEVWGIIEKMYSSHTRARCINTRIALTTTKRDEVIAGGRMIDDEDLLQYIITGLGPDYSEVVSTVCARVEPITLGELYSQLLHFETRRALYNGTQESGSSVKASRGNGFGGQGGVSNNARRGRGGGAPRGRGRGSNNNLSGGNNFTGGRGRAQDRIGKKPLLKGQSWHRLYPLPPSSLKQACNVEKLSLWGFLLYPRHRCLSRDVVFDEHVFPFAKLNPNAGATIRSEISLLPDGDELVLSHVTNPLSITTNHVSQDDTASAVENLTSSPIASMAPSSADSEASFTEQQSTQQDWSAQARQSAHQQQQTAQQSAHEQQQSAQTQGRQQADGSPPQ
uniref:Uncharacterized protein n=1 Tax=Oryza brachyantha TaxID=4533 RepID=J3MFM4_ORYBR